MFYNKQHSYLVQWSSLRNNQTRNHPFLAPDFICWLHWQYEFSCNRRMLCWLRLYWFKSVSLTNLYEQAFCSNFSKWYHLHTYFDCKKNSGDGNQHPDINLHRIIMILCYSMISEVAKYITYNHYVTRIIKLWKGLNDKSQLFYFSIKQVLLFSLHTSSNVFRYFQIVYI